MLGSSSPKHLTYSQNQAMQIEANIIIVVILLLESCD
jgi:hypothetical protein